MPKVDVLNIQGEKVSEIELNDTIFGIDVNEYVLHSVVRMQLANKRQGTHATKTRSFVRGGGRKPWKQKGTGRARAGSIRSPLWVGGGTTFGPQPRSYNFTVPKKVRRLAVRSALSSKVQENNIIVLDNFELPEVKTKAMVAILKNLNVDKKALLVTSNGCKNVQRASQNIPGISSAAAKDLNAYDLLKHDKLVITKDAVASVEEVLA